MKTEMKRAGLALAVVVMSALVFSSFMNKVPYSKSGGDPETEKWEQHNKVYQYAIKKICDPIDAASGNKISGSSFSRCPSGYHPEFVTKEVKTNEFAYGKVQLYSGCRGRYVCDFKICLDKEYVMVKSKDSTTYITVDEWLAERKKQQQEKKEVAKK